MGAAPQFIIHKVQGMMQACSRYSHVPAYSYIWLAIEADGLKYWVLDSDSHLSGCSCQVNFKYCFYVVFDGRERFRWIEMVGAIIWGMDMFRTDRKSVPKYKTPIFDRFVMELLIFPGLGPEHPENPIIPIIPLKGSAAWAQPLNL